MADNVQLLCDFLESNCTKIYPYFFNSSSFITKFSQKLVEKSKIWKENSKQAEKFCEICGHTVFGGDSSCLAAKWMLKPAKSILTFEKIQVLCCNCYHLRDGLALLKMISSSNNAENTEKVNLLASHLSQLIDINTDAMHFLQQIISVSYSIGVLLKTLPNLQVVLSNGEPLNDKNCDKVIHDFISNLKVDKKGTLMTSDHAESAAAKTPKMKKRKKNEAKTANSVKKEKERNAIKKKRRMTVI